MKCDHCTTEAKFTLQNGECYCELCIGKKPTILTIDKCIEYLCSNLGEISDEQHSHLLDQLL